MNIAPLDPGALARRTPCQEAIHIQTLDMSQASVEAAYAREAVAGIWMATWPQGAITRPVNRAILRRSATEYDLLFSHPTPSGGPGFSR